MYVYFLKTVATGQHGSNYLYKIGHATDVAKRIRQLQTGCPTKIELFASLRCASKQQAADVEQRLHAIFANRRRLGEWFQFASRQAWAIRLLARDWPLHLPLEEYMEHAMKQAQFIKDALYGAKLPAWTGLSSIDSLNRKELIDRVLALAPVPQRH